MRFPQSFLLRSLPNGEYFPASVPGNIQSDYGVYNNFGDVSYGYNHLKFLPIEDFEWEYKSKLSYTKRENERVFFVSHGIDYNFDILLNGEKLYSHEGMFAKTELDLTDLLTNDDTLSVVVHKHPKKSGAPEDRNQASESCKPAVSYTWDYHPRLIPSGIWDETYIETRDCDYVGGAEVSYTLSDDLKYADIRFSCDKDVTYSLYDEDGNTVFEGKCNEYRLENPVLWWCSGQGKPYLYTYSIKSRTDEKRGTLGIRKIKLVMNEGAWDEPVFFPKSRSAAPITVELNGRRIFAKGSNWVLPEIFPGNITDETLRKHVVLAHDANMNILRCHGGSGINKDAFYDECDRRGILVWVEFPLACNKYPDDEKYLKTLEQEAKAIINRLKSHVCVSIWCGGNELFNNWSLMTDQSLPLRLLNKLTYELTPEIPFIMTSPLNGMGHGGYTFRDEMRDIDVFTLFQHSRCTAYTEFGVPGTNSVEYLKSIIPPDELFPPKPEGAWLSHHAFAAWSEQAWLCYSTLKRYFEINNIEALVKASEWLQCEGYKAIFEEARRQSPYCSMALNWCFSEPWKTAANNSIVSYPCEPKKAYYAVKDSLRPVLFSLKTEKFDWQDVFRGEVWLLNDSGKTVDAQADIEAEVDGKVYPLNKWNVKSDKNEKGIDIEFKIPKTATNELKIRLKSNEYSSEYRLYIGKVKPH